MSTERVEATCAMLEDMGMGPGSKKLAMHLVTAFESHDDFDQAIHEVSHDLEAEAIKAMGVVLTCSAFTGSPEDGALLFLMLKAAGLSNGAAACRVGLAAGRLRKKDS